MKESNRQKKNAREIIAVVLFITLALSVVYSLVRFLAAPVSLPESAERAHVKSDYLLMLIQCLGGLAVMALPSLISRKWKLDLPNILYVLYYLFLYCAVFLGEVFEFYYIVPHWDSILHAFSGAMLGALGFILVEILNDNEKIKVSLSPAFIALFAFCFALAAGAVWEIYEFTCDGLMDLNMQKFATESGVLLAGRAALNDTMKDIVVDALSALGVSLIGFTRLKTSHANTRGKKM